MAQVFVVVGTFPDEVPEHYSASKSKEKAIERAVEYIEHWCPWLEDTTKVNDHFKDGAMEWTDDKEGDVLTVTIEEMVLDEG